jgi:hypothetical protein
LHFHGIKTFAVNQLFDTGADLKTVMDLAEHLDARLTQEVYGRANRAKQAEAVDAYGERLKGLLPKSEKSPSNEGVTDNMGHAIGLGFTSVPMVGVAGFEPTNDGAKNRCLTA